MTSGGNYICTRRTGLGESVPAEALYALAGLTPVEFLTLFKLRSAPNELQVALQHEMRQLLQKMPTGKRAQWTAGMKQALKEKGTLGGLAFLLRRYL